MMKKIIISLILFLIILSATPVPAADFQKMLDARTAVCWVEGESLDELMLNARGRLMFVCVDRRLGKSFLGPRNASPWDKSGPPEWLRVFGRNFAGRRGETLFVLDIRASKPWTFDTGLLTLAGRTVAAEDVVKGVISDP
ncbi:MAG: hypothetical protein LBS93_05910, partial [Synergistaceae bacterium]|nr:hypothetical protein [Synergistaceae bacterium]